MSERPACLAVAAAVLLMLLATDAGAQALSDPTAPLPSPERRGAAAGPKLWTLQATVVGPERRVAVINGQVAALGDDIDGAKVAAITQGSAELDIDGRRVSLTLFGAAPDNEAIRGTR